MANSAHNLMNYLRTISGAWKDDPRDDAELLTRFVDTQDETAFQTLACRHGSMVWQTCKRVLKNTSDIEDAFQVVFMALA